MKKGKKMEDNKPEFKSSNASNTRIILLIIAVFAIVGFYELSDMHPELLKETEKGVNVDALTDFLYIGFIFVVIPIFLFLKLDNKK